MAMGTNESLLVGAGTGAATGAMIGGMAGGIGAVPGALIGAAVGGISSAMSSKEARRAELARKRALEQSQLAAKERQNKQIRDTYAKRRRDQGAMFGATPITDGGNETTSLLLKA